MEQERNIVISLSLENMHEFLIFIKKVCPLKNREDRPTPLYKVKININQAKLLNHKPFISGLDGNKITK